MDDVFDLVANVNEPPPTPPPAGHCPSLGEQLKKARELRHLSVDDVARALHLSSKQIMAMEAEDWTQLPPNPYLRGFVRNYLRFVEVNDVALQQQVDALGRSEAPPVECESTPVITPEVFVAKPIRENRHGHWSIYAAIGLLLLALLVYFAPQILPLGWFAKPTDSRPSPSAVSAKPIAAPPLSPTTAAAQTATLSPATTPTATVTAAAAVNGVTTAPATTALAGASTQLASTAVAGVEPTTTPEPSAAADLDVIKLGFDRDTWVGVEDGEGRHLLYQMNFGQTSKEVKGKPPFRLVIGSASSAVVTFRGQVIDLKPYTEGDVARLTLPIK